MRPVRLANIRTVWVTRPRFRNPFRRHIRDYDKAVIVHAGPASTLGFQPLNRLDCRAQRGAAETGTALLCSKF